MSNRTPLHYLLSAKDGVDGTDISHALVSLSPDRVERMIARIEESALRRQKDDDFLTLTFWDWSGIEFRNEPDDLWDLEGEEHEHQADYEAITQVQDDQFGRFVIAETFAESPCPRTDTEKMMIYQDGVAWSAQHRYGSGTIRTNGLPIGDLLVARLYYAPEQEIDERFAELARRAPDLALRVIEKGIEVIGQESVTILPHLSAASVATLLESDNAEIRQRAILTLGELRLPDERSRGLSR